MLRRKISESLTARIFLITAWVLLGAGGVTFGLVALAAPVTYTTVINDDLTRQVDDLLGDLARSSFEDCGPLLDAFIRTTGASAALLGPDGEIAATGSLLAAQSLREDDPTMVGAASECIVTSVDDTAAVAWETGTAEAKDMVSVTMSEQDAMLVDVRFADQQELYSLCVTPRIEAENVAVRALIQMAPWLLLTLLAFSLLCALVYSRYITRPIVRLSGIAGKMAELDFTWECGEERRDEIGKLGRSLDEMSRRLSTALRELENANHALRGEVEQERELDRQRMAFFSAASHELKTPVTILKGQLSGMLEGVDVYRDRDKYLLRSLQVTGRMESLIQEMLCGTGDSNRGEGSRGPGSPVGETTFPRCWAAGTAGAAALRLSDHRNHGRGGPLSAG